MFLGSYTFGGELSDLVPAYERLLAAFPPGALEVHVCVKRQDGIQVFDACPSQQDFRDFAHSDGFRGALDAAGLPEPVVIEIGEVHAAFQRESIKP